jgi:putative hemolysin
VNPFGYRQALALHASVQERSQEGSLCARLLSYLCVTWRTGERDLENVPSAGPAIIVANHPFGLLDGAVIAAMLGRVRSDYRILANDLLSAVPELRPHLIPVNIGKHRGSDNVGALRIALRFVQNGGCLIVFPAGVVSHYRPGAGAVADGDWHTAAARIVEQLARKNIHPPLVPLYIGGRNSLLFQLAGMLHPALRTVLLLRELLNKRGRVVDVRIGSRIPAARLLELPGSRERTEYLRWRTYILAGRPEYKPNTRSPIHSSSRLPQPVAGSGDAATIEREIAALPPGACLNRTGGLDVYLAPATTIPGTLREIGRLRELAFRAAGEGTGNSCDLDRFDETYLHLFAWNPARREIAAAYRLAGTDLVDSLYTSTLFRLKPEFRNRLGHALELGRSFVRIEYQRSFAALLALWKGIGAYVANNPRYKILFGPVSISNRYQAVSRELMIAFLETRATCLSLGQFVRHRNGFRGHRHTLPPDLDLRDLSDVVSDLEPSAMGVPVLLRQYLKLGGQLVGFNVDPNFSDALDGLILVDLTKTNSGLRERYLGKAESERFMHHHFQTE